MAAGFITNAIAGYVNPVVNNAVSTAGGFAGDMLGGVGYGISGVGRNIESTIRGYGDATTDYGNAIKDWTKADSGRKGTARNPLGLSDTTSAGKRALTAPSQTAPKKKPEVKFPELPQPGPGPTQKALPPPKMKAPTVAAAKPATGTTKRKADAHAVPKPAPSTSTPSRPPGLPASKYALPSNPPQDNLGVIKPRGKPVSKYAPPSDSIQKSPTAKKGRSLESMPESMRRKKTAGSERRKANNHASRAGASSSAAGSRPGMNKSEASKAAKDPLGISQIGA